MPASAFPRGARVALSGPSGVGNTVIDLLLRYFDPQEGRILLDGMDLRDLDLGGLRRQVAVVSQDIVLFRGSLAATSATPARRRAMPTWPKRLKRRS